MQKLAPNWNNLGFLILFILPVFILIAAICVSILMIENNNFHFKMPLMMISLILFIVSLHIFSKGTSLKCLQFMLEKTDDLSSSEAPYNQSKKRDYLDRRYNNYDLFAMSNVNQIDILNQSEVHNLVSNDKSTSGVSCLTSSSDSFHFDSSLNSSNDACTNNSFD